MIRFEHVTVTYTDAPVPVLERRRPAHPRGRALPGGRPHRRRQVHPAAAVNGHVPHFTGGTLAGRVTVAGRDTRTHRPRDLADVVGVVGQDPMAGFVTDLVEDELAYGMESLGLADRRHAQARRGDPRPARARALRNRPLRTLSGGQRQRVAIGSVLTTHPRVARARRADLRSGPRRRRGGAGRAAAAGARPRASPCCSPSTGSSGWCSTPTVSFGCSATAGS